MRKRMVKRTLMVAVPMVLIVAVAGALTVGCAVLKPLPEPATVAERVEALPLEGAPVDAPVTIHWDEHMIPFIEAGSDRDLAFALGLVHAHLRLGQMELMRRVSTGTLAEVFGPAATDVDQSLRVLDFGQASDEIYAAMPPATRTWLERFCEGVNYRIGQGGETEHEFRVMGISPAPWRPEDVITFARLGGVDLHWMTWFQLLQQYGEPGTEEAFHRLLDEGTASPPSFGPPDGQTVPAVSSRGVVDLVMQAALSRSGSNTYAVSAEAASTGGAIMANDPHLGIGAPGPLLIVGYRTPQRAFVGMMFVGIPLPALGRNDRIAWGGTNMRASASDLYELPAAPADPAGRIEERTERIRVRWWPDRTVTLRRSPLGPLINDVPYLADAGLPPIALRWTGHEPSDEFTAMLRASRAGNWEEFHGAFDGYSLPQMNILYADVDGHIGQLLAARVPRRRWDKPPSLVLDATDPEHAWESVRTADSFPRAFDPPAGFLVSANNTPVDLEHPIGYFFSAGERFERITSLLADANPVGLDAIRRIQADAYDATDAALRDALMAHVDAMDPPPADARPLLRAVAEWDGHYATESTGAAAFQCLLAAFVDEYLPRAYPDTGAILNGSYMRGILQRELPEADPEVVSACLRAGLPRAAAAWAEHGNWGGMHRLSLSHPFSAIPLVGRRYRYGDWPTPGSNETVWKSAHELTTERHSTRYGANSRHISDLADPDANYFVLIGGQDGRIGSEATLDQLPLWLAGDYIRVPLRAESVREWSRYRLTLVPSGE